LELVDVEREKFVGIEQAKIAVRRKALSNLLRSVMFHCEAALSPAGELLWSLAGVGRTKAARDWIAGSLKNFSAATNSA
jgi:hypothetical protein